MSSISSHIICTKPHTFIIPIFSLAAAAERVAGVRCISTSKVKGCIYRDKCELGLVPLQKVKMFTIVFVPFLLIRRIVDGSWR